MTIKSLFILIFIIASAAYSLDYAPLSRTDKKAFVNAAKAIETAAAQGSYGGVLRFGPGVLKKYESIMLDPGCKDLRPIYENIEKLISDVVLFGVADSFQISIDKQIKANDYYGALQKYDSYFDYLHSIKNDSLLAKHEPLYRQYAEKHFNGSYHNYTELAKLKYIDKNQLDGLREIVENSFKESFVTISSASIEELFSFKAQYPGIFDDDIDNLIQSHKARWRLSLKRRPSVEGIERYYLVFSEKDRMIDSLFHNVLYDRFVKEQDIISASKYLVNFPSGRSAREVRMFIEIQERERRMQMYTPVNAELLSGE